MDRTKTTKGLTPIAEEPTPAKSKVSEQVGHQFDGSDRMSISRFDVSKAKLERKPSRYKLQVLRSAGEAFESPHAVMSGVILNSSDRANNTLLDSYEIEWISRQLNYYIESSHGKCNGCDLKGRNPELVEGRDDKVVLKKNLSKRFWPRHGIVCGSSRNDVVESKSSERRKQEEGRMSMMEVVGCRPRQLSLVAYPIGQVGRF